jgi:mannose-6-phosphate isomerase-like protein (cupin superfamily)
MCQGEASTSAHAEGATMDHIILHRDELPQYAYTREFEGYLHGDAGVSFILVDMPPGGGPRLHRHPYEEVFVIQEGVVTFTIGATTFEAQTGQIAIVPGGVPHKFVNSGAGPLRQIDIHCAPQFVTEWLED